MREADVAPWQWRVADYRAAVVDAVNGERERLGRGKLAVITPTALLADLSRVITGRVPGSAVGQELSLHASVVVLDVRQAKGLEFDSVLIVDPAAIIGQSPRGLRDLYVALTRATHRLGVLHTGDLPASLRGLAPREATLVDSAVVDSAVVDSA